MDNWSDINLIDTIDPKVRFLVLYLDAGLSAKTISNVIGRPYSTIQSWVRKTDEGEDIREMKPGRGRKPTYSPETERKIMRDVTQHPGKYSTRSLGLKYGIGHTTVHQILREKGFTYGASHLVQNLTPEEKDFRVVFCQKMLQDDSILFETFFADEMGIKLSDAHPSKGWGKKGTAMEIETPRRDVHLNCWGAISFKGATSLNIFKESMNKDLYQEVLLEHRPELDELYPEGWYLAHDNHPSHTACEGWMEQQGFGQVVFPTYSPDLSPIENMWAALKESVARDAPTTEDRLVASLKRNWETLTLPRNLRSYFFTLFPRYELCIAQEGQRLPI